MMRSRWATAVAASAALLVAGCGQESAADRLNAMSESEWEALSEDEQIELLQDAAAEGVGGQAPEGADVAGAEGSDFSNPVPAGEVFTYPDGLEVTVDSARVESNPGSDPSRVLAIDVTATNPTDEVIETTQVYLNVRAGSTGEELTEWVGDDPSVDAILQPGAEASSTYTYDVPQDDGPILATIYWHDSMDRLETTFAVDGPSE